METRDKLINLTANFIKTIVGEVDELNIKIDLEIFIENLQEICDNIEDEVEEKVEEEDDYEKTQRELGL